MEKKKSKKAVVLWIVIFVLAILVFHTYQNRQGTYRVDHADFLKELEANQVAEVEIDGNVLTITARDSGHRYTTIATVDDELSKKISESGAVITYGGGKGGTLIWGLLGALFIVIFLIVLFGKMQAGSAGGILNLGKSRARLDVDKSVGFADVGGLGEAKEKFSDVIDFLKNPERWQKAGVRLPHGVLLVGPPGCGKTLIARAVAGEADVPFFSVSASEFVEMFIGVGAARVRDTFDRARKEAPALVFIDELDAVGRRRGSGIGLANDEREQTLNQILVCLDGFETQDKVVVIAATNRPDVLDRALLRPGRFDLRILIDVPDDIARLEMLKIHTRNKPLADNVSLEDLARRTRGFTGADLENLANEAALLSVRRVRRSEDSEARVAMEDFDTALSTNVTSQPVFNQLDSVLIESANQLAQPTGGVVVRVTLLDGKTVEGDLIWADGGFFKVTSESGEEDYVLSKAQIHRLEALDGTDVAELPEDLGQWTRKAPEVV